MISGPVSQHTVSDHRTTQQLVLQLLEDRREHTIEELIELAPEISWAQFFSAMDSLSRCGNVELRRQGFTYWLRKAESDMEGAGSTDAAAHPHH